MREITPSEFDAIWAGLRLLVSEMDAGRVGHDDGDIGLILTCGGEREGLALAQIDALANAFDTLRLFTDAPADLLGA